MIVIADTSVLLNLCRVNQVELLQRLFENVIVPPEVADEFSRLATRVTRFRGLHMPGWIRQQSVSVVPAALQTIAGLDRGELAALALALEIGADAILLDERPAHDVAIQFGLRTIGVLGVLLQAKTGGLIPLVAPVLDQLERDAQFWIGARLRARVLQIANEQ